MAYLFPWIFLIFGSLLAGIGLFIWAYHSGQFSDQGRARFLPLRGVDFGTVNRPGVRPTTKPYELLVLFTAAVAILLFTLVLVLVNGKGG